MRIFSSCKLRQLIFFSRYIIRPAYRWGAAPQNATCLRDANKQKAFCSREMYVKNCGNIEATAH